ALDYHNVVIAGTGTKQLSGSASVNDLTFIGTSSNLVANNPSATTLTLNGTIAGETTTSSYIGKLVKSRSINGVVTDTLGNIGISFYNETGGNWGTVVATRVTGAAI